MSKIHDNDEFIINSQDALADLAKRITSERDGRYTNDPKVLSEREKRNEKDRLQLKDQFYNSLEESSLREYEQFKINYMKDE